MSPSWRIESGRAATRKPAEVHVQENKLTTVLDLVLLSLARTQSVMSQSNEEASAIFDDFRQTWSRPSKSNFRADRLASLLNMPPKVACSLLAVSKDACDPRQ